MLGGEIRGEFSDGWISSEGMFSSPEVFSGFNFLKSGAAVGGDDSSSNFKYFVAYECDDDCNESEGDEGFNEGVAVFVSFKVLELKRSLHF